MPATTAAPAVARPEEPPASALVPLPASASPAFARPAWAAARAAARASDGLVAPVGATGAPGAEGCVAATASPAAAAAPAAAMADWAWALAWPAAAASFVLIVLPAEDSALDWPASTTLAEMARAATPRSGARKRRTTVIRGLFLLLGVEGVTQPNDRATGTVR